MMPAYITGIIIAGMIMSKKLIKAQIITAILVHVLIAVQILFYLVPIKSDDTWIGWKELAIETKKLQEQYPNTFVFANDGYKTSAVLNFFMDEKIYAQNIIGLQALHFDYVGDDLSLLNNKDAIFLDSDTDFDNLDKKGKIHPRLSNYFKNIIELEPIIIKRNEKDVRKFWVFYCTNYQYKK